MSTSLQEREITYTLLLTEEDQKLMQSAVEAIAHAGNIRLALGGSTYPLPSLAARKVVNLLNLMGSGVDVKFVPVQEELTVSQTGEFLCMSENHVNDLLDADKFVFRMNGNERMVSRDSLLKFERKRDEGNAFLNELLEMSQEQETYDD